jgi:hypothetical protein
VPMPETFTSVLGLTSRKDVSVNEAEFRSYWESGSLNKVRRISPMTEYLNLAHGCTWIPCLSHAIQYKVDQLKVSHFVDVVPSFVLT